ncbi:MAG TPA: Gfo/Idh/MocA family oxidoreductase [Lacipirellulaceae bacterium]|nr:Gfo/Idh/MocA family oxidoreductase [Lacipirellulaceae bacterium]
MANTRINFGVIGAGGIARRRTIPGMLKAKNCRLVAVMNPSDAGRIAKEFNVARAYRREEQLVDDPDVEAVYIASPVQHHARQIVMCAEAGKHILCEKPLTLDLREARKAVAVCRKHGVFLQDGYMMKFHGAHVKIKELIDQGKLGRIVYLRAQLSCWYPKTAGAWRQDPKHSGGGALIDMASHLYDLIQHFAGPIRKITALTGNLVHDYKSEDASTTLLELESGAQATVDCFFCIPDEASRTRLEIYGSAGAILAEGTIGQSTGGKLEALLDAGSRGYDAKQSKDVARKFGRIAFPKINPYTAECSYFADCVLRQQPPTINDAANSLRIMELIEKAYASAITGRTSRIDNHVSKNVKPVA